MTKGMIALACCVCLPLAAACFAADQQVPKAQTIAEIQNGLYRANIFKHGDVQVSLDNGVATLSGKVDSLGVKQDAEEAAGKVDEVTSVLNKIKVVVDQSTPQQILEQARKEVILYPFYTIFDNVVLEADGGTLTVSGQVTDPFEKDDIGDFLSHVKGVNTLNNNLEVLPVSLWDDQLRRSVARSIYRDPFFVNYANQPLPPIHIIVRNGHVTLEGVVDTEMASRMAANDAAFAGTYFSLTNNLKVAR